MNGDLPIPGRPGYIGSMHPISDLIALRPAGPRALALSGLLLLRPAR